MSSLPPMRAGGVPFLRHLPDYRADPLAFWLSAAESGPVCRVQLGPSLEYWVLTDPDFMQHVLQTKAKSYPRERRLMRLNRLGGPELLFNTDKWDEWLWRRRLMQPAFHRERVAAFAEVITAQAELTVQRWLGAAGFAEGEGARVNLATEMKSLTMRIIGRAMFSVDIERDVAGFQETFEATSEYVFNRAGSAFPPPLWLPTRGNRRALAMAQKRRDMLAKIVAERLAEAQPRGDLLDLLIAAQLEDSGRKFTPDQLIGEMSGIVFAGHETTAQTLTWLLYVVSQHPKLEQRLADEARDVLGDRAATVADLARMPFTERVILETLRLYPPVYVTLREADEADAFGGYDIPVGTRMALNIRGLHRAPGLWENALKFDPDRFDPARSAGRHKWAFIPFLGGPRKCLGDSLAMMEMQLVVPTIVRRAGLQFVGAQCPAEAPGFTLRARGDVDMRVSRRDKLRLTGEN